MLILMNWKYLIMENIKLDGGHLSLEQLNAIFRTIPQEMDVLDENDRVVWSSMNGTFLTNLLVGSMST